MSQIMKYTTADNVDILGEVKDTTRIYGKKVATPQEWYKLLLVAKEQNIVILNGWK